MPSKSGIDSAMSLRRSPRAPARVKVKFGEESQEKRGRKRRRENSNEPDVAIPPPPPDADVNLPPADILSTPPVQVRKKSQGNKKVDKFCWMCHTEAEGEICSVCPRIYHYQCLNPKNRFTEQGLCPECRLESVDGTELSSNLKRRLPVVLPHILERLSVSDPIFKTWSATDVQNQLIVRVMDLSILQDRLANRDMQYKTTASFLADLKWIQHNCNIVYGSHAQLAIKARALVNDCRNELIQLEACRECYVRSIDSKNDDLSVLCDPPHSLVWAKMKGFPYWPAKVLKVINGISNLRFFGTHDKGKLAISQCYSLSIEYPLGKSPSKANFQKAIEEMNMYVSNVIDKFSKFQYFDVRHKFNPGNSQFHSKPPKKAPPPKSNATKSKRGRKSKGTKESEANDSTAVEDDQDVVDISMEHEESRNEQSSEASEVDIEIIEDPHQSSTKNRFMNTLNLGVFRSNNSSGPTVNVHSRANAPSSVEHLPSTSSRVQNLEMQFYEGENPELLSNPSELLSDPSDVIIEENSVPPEETVQGVVSNIMTAVDTSQEYNFKGTMQTGPSSVDIMQAGPKLVNVIQAGPSLVNVMQAGTSSIGVMQMPFETSDNNLTSTMNDSIYQQYLNDYPSAANDQDSIPCTRNFPNPPAQLFIHKMIPHLHRAFNETYREYVMPHLDCQKIEGELREEVDKQKRIRDELKENTDLVISSLTDIFEIEKQKAIEEAKKSWEAEMDAKIQEAVQAAVNEANENLEKEHGKEMACKITEHLSSLQELEKRIKGECEKEKEEAVEKSVSNAVAIARKKWCKASDAEIVGIKRKQWCAYCLNEARFFCCWNTSYCNANCQQKHWPTHNIVCDNLARPVEAAAAIPDTEKVYLNSKKSNKNNTNGQPLPTLRLNGQSSSSRFYISGTTNPAPPSSTAALPVVTVAQRSQVIKPSKRPSTNQMPPKKAYLSSPLPTSDAKISEEQGQKEKEKKPALQP